MKIWKRKAKRMSPAFRMMLTFKQKMRVMVKAVLLHRKVDGKSDDLCIGKHSVLRGGLSKLLFWENRCLNLLIGVELSGDPRGAAFDPAILAIYGQK